MSKLERLLNLMAALLETGRPLSATEIQSRVPGYPESRTAFHRAFERDKEDLREMGVPVQLIPIPGTDPLLEGYRIPKSLYYLPDPGLEPDELAALHLASAVVRLDGITGIEGLWKLGGRPQVVTEAPAAQAVALPTNPDLVPLFSAVVERRPSTFRYHDQDREVEPHRLDFRRGWWYLTAFDRGRDAERSYRVDRIEGPILLGEPGGFERPTASVAPPESAPWEMGEEEPVRVRLIVDADQAIWAVQHLGQEAVEAWREDGSVVVAFDVANRTALRSFVITFLEHAEILEPREIRDDYVAWLEVLAS